MKIANSKDVKKALNCCIKREKSKDFCKNCPYEDNCRHNRLEKDILTVIEALEKENKELQSLCNKTYDDLTKEIDRIKANNECLKINLANEKKWGKIQAKQVEKETARKIFGDIESCIEGMLDGERYMTKNEVEYFLEHILNKKQEYDVGVDYEN